MEGKGSDPLRHTILEAVECLRLRKCRPDRNAIAHYVLRKHGSTMNEIFAEIENVVDDGGLIKVEYKGETSYRNPHSFDTKNSPLLTKHSKILNSTKTTRLILSAINELLAKDPTFSQSGVPLKDLKDKLKEFDNSKFTEETMNNLLEREISCGGINAGKSSVLKEQLRIFPKDISVPHDMDPICTLNIAAKSTEGKRRKQRKVNPSEGGGGEGRKKQAAKTEAEEEGDGVDDNEKHNEYEFDDMVEVPPPEEEDDEEEGNDQDSNEPKKGRGTPKPMSSAVSAGKKIVAEKVAEAIRKSYESTAEFESTSAQMIKLAEAVVTKHGEHAEASSPPKGPSLVLASAIASLNKTHETKHTNGESGEHDADSNALLARGRRGKGRGSLKQGPTPTTSSKKEKPIETDASTTSLAVEEKSSPTDLGVTRSKRDKRKKMVFDPSDLPTTYARVLNKKARLSEIIPPQPKALVLPPRQGRKSMPAVLDLIANGSGNGNSVLRKAEEACHMDDIPESTHDGEEISSHVKTEPCVNLVCSTCEKGVEDDQDFLTCSTCHANTHRACVGYWEDCNNKSKGLTSQVEWNCLQCRICSACNEQLAVGDLGSNTTMANRPSICTRCDGAYHFKCSGNENAINDEQGWTCPTCSQDGEEPVTKGHTMKLGKPKSSGSKRPELQASSSSATSETADSKTTTKFPDDLRLWSKEDVEQYFTEKGLKEEAANMLRQEVDGYTLVLLQREDVVGNMGFRLGPALKVYRLVHELQEKAPVQPHPSWTSGQTDTTV